MSLAVILLFTIVAVVLVLLVFGFMLAGTRKKENRLRHAGLYPPEGQETSADVDRLLQLGHKIEAIKVYRKLHQVDLKDAKDAVEKRQQEIGGLRGGCMTAVCAALVAVLMGVGAADAQTLEVSGDVIPTTVLFDEGDLTTLPQQVVEVPDGDRTIRFEGPWLADVLKAAGVTFGHGPGLAQYLLAEAADGYAVVYALAELDPQLTYVTVLLALRQDGVALSSDDGPFRLIASSHRHPARWVRQVQALRVMRARE